MSDQLFEISLDYLLLAFQAYSSIYNHQIILAIFYPRLWYIEYQVILIYSSIYLYNHLQIYNYSKYSHLVKLEECLYLSCIAIQECLVNFKITLTCSGNNSTLTTVWVSKLKFNFDVAPLGGWKTTNQTHEPPSRQNYNPGGGGGSNNHNRWYNQDPGGDRGS